MFDRKLDRAGAAVDVTTALPAEAGVASVSVTGATHNTAPASGHSTSGLAPAGSAAPPACGARDEIAALRADAAALASVAAGASGWTGPDRQEALTELNLTIDTLAAVRSALLIAERDAPTWRGHGRPDLRRVGRAQDPSG